MRTALSEEQIDRLGDEADQWRREHYPYSDPSERPNWLAASPLIDGWRQGFSVGWISAYERYQVNRLQQEREALLARLEFVLARTPTEDRLYTFPDGESWPASQALG